MGIEEAGRSNKMFNLAQLAGWRESSSHGARFPPPHHAPTDPLSYYHTSYIILRLLGNIRHTNTATIET